MPSCLFVILCFWQSFYLLILKQPSERWALLPTCILLNYTVTTNIVKSEWLTTTKVRFLLALQIFFWSDTVLRPDCCLLVGGTAPSGMCLPLAEEKEMQESWDGFRRVCLMVCASPSLTFRWPRRKPATQASCVWSRRYHCLTGKGSERLGTILQSTMRLTGLLWWIKWEGKGSFWLSSKHIVCALEINFTFHPCLGSKVKLNKGQTHEIFQLR